MQLISLMADGGFHSGEELGARLGISRTAVWKQLAALRKRGLEFEVVPGKGYRLLSPLEPWSEEKLRALMGPTARQLLRRLRVEERVASTNDEVMALMRAEPVSGVVCLAEEQTAGRGRRGRDWMSPLGGNFYGSVGWAFAEGIAAVEGLSLAIGVAVVRALRRYGLSGVQLKWPNDIVVGEAKLGGVLIELQAEAEGPCVVVVGLGLNLHLPENAAELLQRAVTDVASLAQQPLRRNELGALLLEEILQLLAVYPQQGFSGVREEWLAYDALRDQPVTVTGLDRPLSGLARGVNAQGALMVETESGAIALHGGEVSLRKSYA